MSNLMMDACPRVVMVSGAYPPDVCGVGDYTERLMTHAPANWQLFVARDWSRRSAKDIVRRLFACRPDAVVIQYPTQGYGWSLVPHLLALLGRVTGRYKAALALHEFSSLSGKAQAALALASHAATQVIFTTEVERDRARGHRLFDRDVPTSVIGILSNIPQDPDPPAFGDRRIDLAYFGHIRPNKGLEDFLDVMASMRASEPQVHIAVIGEIPTGYEAFGAMVAARCKTIGAELILGLDDTAAGRTLADVRLLYLPFHDGVSARRGSVLAGFGNGAIVATRIGEATPAALKDAVVACAGTTDDVAILRDMLRLAPEPAARWQQAGRDYVAKMLPRDWGDVVSRYDKALAEMLRR